MVLAPVFVSAQDPSATGSDDSPPPAPGPPVAVQGTVINAATGAPLARALVRIDSSEVLAALTGNDGRFIIDGVPSGEHTIVLNRPGFKAFPQNSETWESVDRAVAVMVAAGNPPLTLSLSPLNAIRVHVTLSNGVPASNIGLTLYRQSIADGRRAWIEDGNRQTDPSGESRFPGLSDGAYILATQPEYGNTRARDPDCGTAAPPAMPGYAVTFLPSATDSAAASPILVSAGQTADVNTELAPAIFYLVRFTLNHVAPADDGNLTLHLTSRSGEILPYVVHQEKGHGFCAYLPDGSYTATLDTSGQPASAVDSSAPSSTSLFANADFTVDGAAPAPLRLALRQTAATPIHFLYEPRRPAPSTAANDEDDEGGEPLEIAVIPVHSAQPRDSTALEAIAVEENAYNLSPVRPGPYWLHADTAQKGVCLGTVTAGGEDLASVPWIAGPSGSGPPIDAVLRTDCAQLKLALPPGASAENPGDDSALYLYAVPLFPSLQDAASAQIQPISQRTAELDDLTPGAYRIFLFRSPRSLAFREPGGLDALGSGQDITLQPGDRQTLILNRPPQ